jgi:hypothetical protein
MLPTRPIAAAHASQRRLAILLSLLLALAMLAACSEGGIDVATTTPTATPSPIISPTPATSTAVRSAEELDFTAASVIGPLIDHFGGGEIESSRIEYVDLSGDGQNEAFVIVESGGTMGDLGAALVGLRNGQPEILGTVDAGGHVELRFPEVGGGIVVVTAGVWEPDDPLCCPSNLQERTFEWREDEFVLVDEQVVDNPEVD